MFVFANIMTSAQYSVAFAYIGLLKQNVTACLEVCLLLNDISSASFFLFFCFPFLANSYMSLIQQSAIKIVSQVRYPGKMRD